MITYRIDETGKRYGRLIVLKFIERSLASRFKRSKAKWLCKCDCGNLTAIFGDKLRGGHVKSCLSCERAWRMKPDD